MHRILQNVSGTIHSSIESAIKESACLQLCTNKRRPILTLLEDTCGVHDTLIAACDIYRYQAGHSGVMMPSFTLLEALLVMLSCNLLISTNRLPELGRQRSCSPCRVHGTTQAASMCMGTVYILAQPVPSPVSVDCRCSQRASNPPYVSQTCAINHQQKAHDSGHRQVWVCTCQLPLSAFFARCCWRSSSRIRVPKYVMWGSITGGYSVADGPVKDPRARAFEASCALCLPGKALLKGMRSLERAITVGAPSIEPLTKGRPLHLVIPSECEMPIAQPISLMTVYPQPRAYQSLMVSAAFFREAIKDWCCLCVMRSN